MENNESMFLLCEILNYVKRLKLDHKLKVKIITNIIEQKSYDNMIKQRSAILDKKKFSTFIHGAFVWAATPEGHDYWEDIYNEYKKVKK